MRILHYVLMGAATYYSASFVQAMFHRIFGHTRRIGKLYDVHVRGHHAQYAKQMLSDKWIPTEQHVTWYYTLPLAMIAGTIFAFFSWDLVVVHLLALALAVWWHVYLHRQYHVRGSWFERFAWFQRKRKLHFLHHQHPRKNYAIVEYTWDRLLGTLKDG